MNGGQLVVASVVGAVVGCACGMIPFRAGVERRQPGLAFAAIITCTVLGALGGCILGLPAAFFFKWIIMAVGPASESATDAWPDHAGRPRPRHADDTPPPAPREPYTILGTAVVCNRCGTACSKVDGRPPSECPQCHRSFEAIPRVQPIPRARRVSEVKAEEEVVALERA